MNITFSTYQADVDAMFKFDLEPHHSNSDIVSCIQEVEVFVGNHDNWNKPIIPGDDDCTQLDFQPEIFEPKLRNWVCSASGKGICKIGKLITVTQNV